MQEENTYVSVKPFQLDASVATLLTHYSVSVCLLIYLIVKKKHRGRFSLMSFEELC